VAAPAIARRIAQPNVILDRPLPRLLAERARTDPDATAVILDGRALSYGEISDRSADVATFLRNLGIQAGDPVGLLSANSPEFIYAWFAVLRIRAVEVPINPAAVGHRLAYMLADSQSSVLICEAELLPGLQGVELPSTLKTVIVIPSEAEPDWSPPDAVTCYRFDECLGAAQPSGEVDASVTFADVAAIIYTSGTTGPSKGVLCPHGHIRTLGLDTIDMFELTTDDTLYDAHPLFHAHGQGQVVFASLAMGIPAILRRRFSASGFVQDLHDHRVTVAFLIGAAALVLKQPPSGLETQLALRRVCAVPVPRGAGDELERRFGVPFIETYGMTELGVIAYTLPDGPREDTCGRPSARRIVRIGDDNDDEVPVGEVGEVLVRPVDSSSIMAGYFGKPAETVEAWRNLWFHTGDLGYVDKDGYIFFVGRKKDSIRRRGENISAFEVESVLTSMPAIQEAAVLAWPSPVGEDDVWAVLVPAPGAMVTAQEVTEYCRGRLDRYAIPRYLSFGTDLPKTPTERIEKYKLLEQGLPADVYDNETASEV
jgi:carnitine-CoA ligase